MDSQFTPISPFQIKDNIFKLLDKDWMLVTAGIPKSFNTMTASWGGFGVLWNKPVAYVFIRPVRFTYEFAEKFDQITLSFFTEEHRKSLNVCGNLSGRNSDKVRKAGLTAIPSVSGGVTFNESRLYFDCHKLYFTDINPANFCNPDIDKHYPLKDYHRLYICEIINCYEKEL
jgi:flavin reductase (DIM6/NTAB) family NADH-FMN oxidoreductase RutF